MTKSKEEYLIHLKNQLRKSKKNRREYLKTVTLYSMLSLGSILGVQSKLNHNPFKYDNKNAYQVEYLLDENNEISYLEGEIVKEGTELSDLPQTITHKTGWVEANEKEGKYFRSVRVYSFQNISFEDLKKIVENPYFLTHFHSSKELDPEYANFVSKLFQEEWIIKTPHKLEPIKMKQTFLQNMGDVILFFGLSGLAIFIVNGLATAYFYDDNLKNKKHEKNKIRNYEEEIKLFEETQKENTLKRKNKNYPQR